MDETRFDIVIRSLGTGASRRKVLGALAGVAGLGVAETIAKSRHRSAGKRKAKTSVRAAASNGPGQGRYQTLAAKWWSWAIGENLDPITETGAVDCSAGQQGQTWFLGGSNFNMGPIVRTCTIPKKVSLFFPVVNAFAFAPPSKAACPAVPVHTQKQLDEHRKCAASFIDTFSLADLTATLDGNDVPIVRAQSALFPLHLGDDNPFADFGVTAGIYLDAADGFWVLLDPLSPGVHKIHFVADSVIDVTFKITVT